MIGRILADGERDAKKWWENQHPVGHFGAPEEGAAAVVRDVGNKVARQFGIVFELSDDLVGLYCQFGHAFEEANGGTGKKELLVPGTVLFDGKGTVPLAHVDVDYTHTA